MNNTCMLLAPLQVFQSFIEGFGVYGPLLSQIKQVFDQAVEDGLKDALENTKLRKQLSEARQQQVAVEAAARAEVMDGRQRHDTKHTHRHSDKQMQ